LESTLSGERTKGATARGNHGTAGRDGECLDADANLGSDRFYEDWFVKA